MSVPEFKELLHRYNAGLCTEEEKAIIESWYIGFEMKNLPEFTEEELAEILSLKPAPERKIVPITRWISAAAILLCLSIGSYFLLHKRPAHEVAGRVIAHDLDPGSDKAILTIGNGKKIVLTGARNGKLAIQGNMVIDKTADGQVVYQADNTPANELTHIIYNTMTTPRGGKYDLVLADGTKVWLDAASSVTYPTAFSGDSREISMTGQAYFEVAHDSTKPFRVKVNGQTVEVLGTHFNINGYEDEPVIKTTLLEGRVKVSKNTAFAVLAPGQESLISASENKIKVHDVDVEGATAWKDGHFHFDDDDIQTVMRQLSRWYDVDVEYVGDIPKREFTGNINRNTKASVVLQILSFSKVHFKIEGKKIIVTP